MFVSLCVVLIFVRVEAAVIQTHFRLDLTRYYEQKRHDGPLLIPVGKFRRIRVIIVFYYTA